MSVPIYTRNQPVAGDDLDISQPFLVNNTNAADSVFGFDHYAFSSDTNVRGLHNKVTTPNFVDSPPTNLPPSTSGSPIFYGFTPGGVTPSTNLPVIQWSRGVSNAVPTPLTSLNSSVTPVTIDPMTSINIFNFSGIGIAMATLTAFNADPALRVSIIANIYFDGTNFYFLPQTVTGFTVDASGTTLILTNTSTLAYNNVYWTLQFKRIQ